MLRTTLLVGKETRLHVTWENDNGSGDAGDAVFIGDFRLSARLLVRSVNATLQGP